MEMALPESRDDTHNSTTAHGRTSQMNWVTAQNTLDLLHPQPMVPGFVLRDYRKYRTVKPVLARQRTSRHVRAVHMSEIYDTSRPIP